MRRALIIGGTRNIGYYLSQQLLSEGYELTILNRGMSSDALPQRIERLRADRSDAAQMKQVLSGRSFDVVIDFVMYREDEAQMIVDLLAGQIGHYIFISSGQVYLVRENIARPFSEEDFEGRIQPEPKLNTFAHEEWSYGIGKRRAETVFRQAWAQRHFPYTSLRLPMVNSERDTFRRLYSYIIRLEDGGPILVPETPNYKLSHVYGKDVVRIIGHLVDQQLGIGRAYNLSQDERVSIDAFLQILGQHLGVVPHLVRTSRSTLEENGFLPYCSPFSERWMSELDNRRSKAELNATYTALSEYLGYLVAYYRSNKPSPPLGYSRRAAEIQFAREHDDQTAH